ncbi:FG-GAP-like repeat-containing protein [Streptomyces sp. MRC013]|uniref:FG-GAP-like repeat-containing protein n=1 Tax=Streptomyces sp. MRC013 TaxID=2898276 RepID=UPI0020273775|nr:FG-GAP-like repeat-containing protein [Streptomyces sp. MRC013]URM90470.1 FG-GAP-like repeat-containing protein [Streptomyces sp. MRC013]
MASSNSGNRLKRLLAFTAAATAMAAAAGTAAAAEGRGTAGAEKTRATEEARYRTASPGQADRRRAAAPGAVATPTFSMTAVDKKTSNLYLYFPNGRGGFEARYDVGVDYSFAAAVVHVDNDEDGYGDGTWNLHKDGKLSYVWSDGSGAHVKDVGRGWTIYTDVLSPGDLGGTRDADLMAVDEAGVLWTYVGHASGLVDTRVRVGKGWDAYTEIAGQGDLSGDGGDDIVARDRTGVLWLYKGTGNNKAPFEARTRIGAGWNTYDRLLSVGDLDADGRSDLVARSAAGDLFRYSGTGRAAAPFTKPVKIGTGYGIYNLL